MAGECIFIVEDDYLTKRALMETITQLGFNVVGSAISGKEAISKVSELKPDLVLMDINLEGEMDGTKAADEIITELSIPVIYITAHTEFEVLKDACRTDFSGYITKPFTKEELKVSIEKTLTIYRSEGKSGL